MVKLCPLKKDMFKNKERCWSCKAKKKREKLLEKEVLGYSKLRGGGHQGVAYAM